MDTKTFIKDTAKRINKAERSELMGFHDRYQHMQNEVIRRAIIQNNRIDILAQYVLGYQVQPFHLDMAMFQFAHPHSLQLAYRGAGKSSICTVVKAIHLLIKDRNLRILIASNSRQSSESFLKEIKAHLESNDKLIELFGEFYNPRTVERWDNSRIEIVGKDKSIRESSIACFSCESQIIGYHADVALLDDLVTEDTARTAHMRDKLKTWYYKSLDPVIMPPDPKRPHVGERHLVGTRYNVGDLWGHLIANELKDHHNIIPALDENGNSPWPEMYPPAYFEEKKEKAGIIVFASQYLCSTEAMKGEVFSYDNMQELNPSDWPDEKDLNIYMGVDLAISGNEKDDQFAIVVIGCQQSAPGTDPDAIFVLDFFAKHIRFPQQKPTILKYYDKWEPIAAGVETNAYQKAQFQDLKEDRPTGRFVPLVTDKDKMTRAWKLSAYFDANKVFFRKGSAGAIIDQLVLFPSHKLKDLFDALDFAVATAKIRKRRERKDRREIGLI